MFSIDDTGFWAAIDSLAAKSEIVIDRQKGSVHSRYPDFTYPLYYGYLEGTTAADGNGIRYVAQCKGKSRISAG